MNFFQTTLINGLEYIRDKLEEHDSNLQKRKRIFSEPEQPQEGEKNENRSTGSSEEINAEEKPTRGFKQVSFELLDISVHYGEIGFNKVKETQAYKNVDQYVDFQGHFAQMVKTGTEMQELYNSLESLKVGFGFLPNRVLVLFAQIQNVSTIAKNTSYYAWCHLDQDQDGKVSCSDIKESLSKAYTFVIGLSCSDINNYKLELFKNAIAYMKEELENDKKMVEIAQDEKLCKKKVEKL